MDERPIGNVQSRQQDKPPGLSLLQQNNSTYGLLPNVPRLFRSRRDLDLRALQKLTHHFQNLFLYAGPGYFKSV